MNRKIVIFSANYLPNLGGVERYTYFTAQQILKRNDIPIVVTSNVFNLAPKEIVDNVLIYRIPCFTFMNGRFPLPNIFSRRFYKIACELKKIESSLVIINTRFYVHSILGAIYALIVKSKSIVIEHGTGHIDFGKKLIDEISKIYEHMITSILKLLVKKFYAVSKEGSQWLRHFGISSNGELYNSIDIEGIDSIFCDQDNNCEVSSESKRSIVFAGRLIKQKGVLVLIDSFKEISKYYNDVELIIAGDGELLQEIKKTENSNIKVVGKIDFYNVIRLLKNSYIFCLPTMYPEGFPTSVLEAVASKTFVLTSNRGGSKELIVNSDYGIILEEINVKSLVDALRKVLDDENYRNRCIENSYRLLIEEFTWESTVAKLYSELL